MAVICKFIILIYLSIQQAINKELAIAGPTVVNS